MSTDRNYEAERASTKALFRNVTKEEIRQLVIEWFKSNGEIPRRIDWDPSMAIRVGKPELADRFYSEGAWPLAGTVVSLYGSFTAAIIDAGFYPRMRTREWVELNPESRASYLRDAIHALEGLGAARRA